MKQIRPNRAHSQSWKTFLRNHAAEVWACDFLQAADLFFHPLFAFFNTLLKSRKVIHVNVTCSPTDQWVAQQLREATPYGQTPKYLIRDNDRKFGPNFARVATTSSMKVLRTPIWTRASRMPSANAFWRASGENVSITFSFSMRSTSPGFSWRMQCTSIMPDLIKGSSSRSRFCRCFLCLHRTNRIS
jgi:hypothetical protein